MIALLLALSTSTIAMPDPKLTPGVVDEQVTVQQLCVPGYTAKIRLVTSATKTEVFRRYGIPRDGAKYEVDHFISLEIGGKNDIENLWPQNWKEARLKDVVETTLHRWMCKGKITKEDAIRIIRTDWYGCYKTIKAKGICK